MRYYLYTEYGCASKPAHPLPHTGEGYLAGTEVENPVPLREVDTTTKLIPRVHILHQIANRHLAVKLPPQGGNNLSLNPSPSRLYFFPKAFSLIKNVLPKASTSNVAMGTMAPNVAT